MFGWFVLPNPALDPEAVTVGFGDLPFEIIDNLHYHAGFCHLEDGKCRFPRATNAAVGISLDVTLVETDAVHRTVET